ncbi:hypothetical protein ACJX0J_037654, partial [Zea mays]
LGVTFSKMLQAFTRAHTLENSTINMWQASSAGCNKNIKMWHVYGFKEMEVNTIKVPENQYKAHQMRQISCLSH